MGKSYLNLYNIQNDIIEQECTIIDLFSNKMQFSHFEQIVERDAFLKQKLSISN